MSQATALNAQHRESNAKMVDFAGWDMPINYGSQIEEHHQVRQDAGMFDVSHMTVIDFEGQQIREYLRFLLANDVAKLTESGKALYSCMLNKEGGVIDDLIVYYLTDSEYRMVVNAATRDKDLAWLNNIATDFDIKLTVRDDLSMIAVQGPNARSKSLLALGDSFAPIEQLKPFFAYRSEDHFIARTGYTGEDGYEIMLPNEQAPQLWNALLEQGVKPIGLGARDTLRLEAGMNLYGQDMDEQTSPLEAALAWTVAMQDERDFIGRDILQKQKDNGLRKKLVGLILEDKGVLRHDQVVKIDGGGSGIITSGGFSPTLEKSIAFASVPIETGNHCQIEVRNKLLNAKVVKAPFVRFGKACFKEVS